MGRAIATRLLAGDNAVTLYDPQAAAAERLATELRATGAGARVSVASELATSVAASEVVIMATPYRGSLQLAHELGGALDGKIVVDISNPLNESYDGLVTAGGPSGAENIRGALPGNAKLVKAFNTTFAGTLVEGTVAGVPLDVFVAGDDTGAKERVAALVRSGGLHPVDVGGLIRARELEALGFLGIALQPGLGSEFATGWKLLLPASRN